MTEADSWQQSLRRGDGGLAKLFGAAVALARRLGFAVAAACDASQDVWGAGLSPLVPPPQPLPLGEFCLQPGCRRARRQAGREGQLLWLLRGVAPAA